MASPTTSGRSSGLTRSLAIGGILIAAVLVALLMFGGADKYTVTADFANAGQLVPGNLVEVGGRPIGTIKEIELTEDARARVTMELEELTPLHEGTSATIRVNSLSGIANRYVAITPGPNDGDEIEDGGEIKAEDASAPVEIDQLFNTLDEDTRKGLQQFVQGQATYYDGKGKEANEALKYLNPAISSSSKLTRELVLDQEVFERFITDGAQLVEAVAERREDLSQLVGNANATAEAIGSESEALQRALALLPDTLRKANTTFVNLRGLYDDLDVLVAESKPATKDLARFFRELRPLVEESEPTIEDLRFLIRRDGENNDLIELTAKMPRLADLASTTFPRSIRALQKAQPVIEYIRPYTPDFMGWLTKFGQGAAAYDANGHYARIQPIFNAFSYSETPAGPVLNAIPPSQRLAGLETRQTERCPGGATQPPPAGSAPWRGEDGDIDCDPETTPPGP